MTALPPGVHLSEPGREGGSCLSREACNSARSLRRGATVWCVTSVHLRVCLRRWAVLWLPFHVEGRGSAMRPRPAAHEGLECTPGSPCCCGASTVPRAPPPRPSEDSHSWAPLRPRDSKPLGPGPGICTQQAPGIPLYSRAWGLLTSGSVSQGPAGEARPAQG